MSLYKTPAKWRSQNIFRIASDFMLMVLVVGRFAGIVASEIAATDPYLGGHGKRQCPKGALSLSSNAYLEDIMGVQRPKCERKGTLPHPATMIVAWSLQSGRLWKFSCDEHVETFGGPSYVAARLEGLVDNHSNGQPVHPINSPYPPAAVLAEVAQRGNSLTTDQLVELLDVPAESRLNVEDGTLHEATCVDPECGNPAHKGEFCDECHGAWEEEQRAKAAAAAAKGRPRAINQRRGF